MFHRRRRSDRIRTRTTKSHPLDGPRQPSRRGRRGVTVKLEGRICPSFPQAVKFAVIGMSGMRHAVASFAGFIANLPSARQPGQRQMRPESPTSGAMAPPLGTGQEFAILPKFGDARRREARLRSACLSKTPGPDHPVGSRKACAQGKWLPSVRGEGAVRAFRLGLIVDGCLLPPADRRRPISCTREHLPPALDMRIRRTGGASASASGISLT